MLTLHPLDFEEFLWSQDEEQLAELIRESYEDNSFFPLAEKALGLLRSYWAVGGLPESINRYSKNKVLSESTGILQIINKAYIGDIAFPPIFSCSIKHVTISSVNYLQNAQ